MAAAVPFIVGGAAILSASNSIRQGRAAKAASEHDAEMARQNALIEKQNTLEAVRTFDREQYLRTGAVKAAQGKSGGTATSGNVLDVLSDLATQGAIERQAIQRRGAIREQGLYDTADQDSLAGKSAMSGAFMQAGSDLLAGAANSYTAYSRLQRTK